MPRLVLIRHAKSSWTTGLDDPQRPLSNRGRRDAAALGELLRDRKIIPELLWCSDAVRARETWDRARDAGARAQQVELRPELYGASAAQVQALAKSASRKVRTLMMIGHHDGIPGCLSQLARRDGDEETWASIDRKYPTAACAVLECSSWADLAPGTAHLLWYQVPRG